MATMNFRCTDDQKEAIEAKAKEYGFDSVGAYIKFASINAKLSASMPIQKAEVSKVGTNKVNSSSDFDADIDKKIKAYKKAYVENYTDFTAETHEALSKAKDVLCTAKPSKEDAFFIIDKMSHISGSTKSRKQALQNEEKYVFQVIELFRLK